MVGDQEGRMILSPILSKRREENFTLQKPFPPKKRETTGLFLENENGIVFLGLSHPKNGINPWINLGINPLTELDKDGIFYFRNLAEV